MRHIIPGRPERRMRTLGLPQRGPLAPACSAACGPRGRALVTIRPAPIHPDRLSDMRSAHPPQAAARCGPGRVCGAVQPAQGACA
jgi:hypothetical protein